LFARLCFLSARIVISASCGLSSTSRISTSFMPVIGRHLHWKENREGKREERLRGNARVTAVYEPRSCPGTALLRRSWVPTNPGRYRRSSEENYTRRSGRC